MLNEFKKIWKNNLLIFIFIFIFMFPFIGFFPQIFQQLNIG